MKLWAMFTCGFFTGFGVAFLVRHYLEKWK